MNTKNPFPYFVGINSLEDIAPKEAKVCVMNILGNESKSVTPTSHTFSGGNIVAGIQYGRSGTLETKTGNIPVYSRLADAIKNHPFDTGVIYLPPDAVFHSVTELCHYNKELKKIVIVTEKISVKDQRLIRAVCQANKIDVFGANSLGVADAWEQVRIGGALGGDKPEEALVKGSIAIHSNSGNFSTTIAEYLKTGGFGTTTLVSSGKDVIIQFAVPEFLYAAQRDERTKGIVLYVEPGGYYEHQALELMRTGDCKLTKPLVVCVTGRWKSNLTRACGHAGALAGQGDDAVTKEKWFDNYFGVPVFNPDEPERVSEKGVRVFSIQHIPQAMEAVFKKCNLEPDFKPQGNLGLKPWFGNDFGLELPKKLILPIVEAIYPYNKEIERINKELGASFLRQRMRNASAASRINSTTSVAELHGKSILNLIDYPYESNMIFALTKKHPQEDELDLLNICLNYLSKSDEFLRTAILKAKENNANPNQTLMSFFTLIGDSKEFKISRKYIAGLLNVFSGIGLRDINSNIDVKKALTISEKYFNIGETKTTSFSRFLIKKIKNNAQHSTILAFAIELINKHQIENIDIYIVSTIFLNLAYTSLVLKKITRLAVENIFTYLSLEAKAVLLVSKKPKHNEYLSEIQSGKNFEILATSFAETAYQAVFNKKPNKQNLREFSALLALTLTNGPGTISAKGAKESVSARNNIATSFTGFLANTGLAHGGNGYEAIEFLLSSLKDVKIENPGVLTEGIDVKEISRKAADEFLEYKNEMKFKGVQNYKRIPCINHPVFKGRKKNIDPREDFLYKQFKSEKINNLFWEFYHHLVENLYEVGATNNIYCVNIDAVIAVISLKLMWKKLKTNLWKDKDIQDIGFIIFLLGRMIGVSAEISDHMDRGTDMDCRTPQSETRFIV